ncbi:hypothetical protein D9M72_426560 [compost metagenome]
MRDPVEAEHSVVAFDAGAGDHHVVAAFGVVVVFAGTAGQDVMARSVDVVEERCAAVALQQVVGVAAFLPVIAAAAEHCVRSVAGKDQVVAFAGERLVAVEAAVGEVVPISGHDDVQARACVDGVVSVAALQDVIAVRVRDPVVSVSAKNSVGTVVAFDDVLAVVAPERIVVDAAPDPVTERGAVEGGLGIEARTVHGVADAVPDGAVRHPHEQRGFVAGGGRVVGDGISGACRYAAELELAVSHAENICLEGFRIRIAHDELRQRVAFQLRAKVQP